MHKDLHGINICAEESRGSSGASDRSKSRKVPSQQASPGKRGRPIREQQLELRGALPTPTAGEWNGFAVKTEGAGVVQPL